MLAAIPALLANARVPYATGPELSVPWARIAIAFLICVALAAAAIHLLRNRYGRKAAPRSFGDLLRQTERGDPALELEERLRITPTGQVCVIRCEGRRYLLHIGQQGCTLIDRLDDRADG